MTQEGGVARGNEALIRFVARALAEGQGHDPDAMTEDDATGRRLPAWERFRQMAVCHVVASDAVVRFAMTQVDDPAEPTGRGPDRPAGGTGPRR